MTHATDRSDLETQRVPARTRGALLAGAVATAAIALLVAKPWQPPTAPDVSPEPAPTVAVADLAATPAPRSEGLEEAPGVFALEIGSPGDVARCLYDTTRKDEKRLGAILVLPPRAYVAGGSDTERTRDVGWRVELQANRQETLFTAEWTPIGESRLQVVSAMDGTPAHFFPMEVQVDPASVSKTAVIRARLIVDWDSPNVAEVRRSEMILPTYVLGGRASGPPRQSCPGYALEHF